MWAVFIGFLEPMAPVWIHHCPLVPKLPSNIKDTTHFLKKLDDLK